MKSLRKSLIRARAIVFSLALALAVSAPIVAQQNRAQLPTPADLSRTFINVAKQVKPAVVNIDVVEKARRVSRLPEGFPQIPGMPDFGGQGPSRPRGTGSGVIISPDGYILTNNHVVGEAVEIKVKLSDGREVKASRVGTDPETDLAVIKVDLQGLPFAKLGDSERVEQGEWVIALGSPFGLSQTMTAGIVSATGRELRGAGQFTNFIQTDASINPGNSGGPLVNMDGEVIGINTMIFSRTGGNEGIGFAIPSNLSSKVYAQLIKSGRVTRGYLGLYPTDVTPTLARTVGYDGEGGALVQDVSGRDTPAAKAGLKSGDVITEVDGKAVKTARQLTEIVADLPVGKPVQVKFVRDGRVQTATVTLGERPRPNETSPENEGSPEQEMGKIGISVQTITPEQASTLKIKSGAVVMTVQPGSPAAESGITQGDVIHKINRFDVTSAQTLIRALEQLKGETQIVLQIERSGQLSFVPVSLE
ncbi:MAG TPA: Do family serine endopeptidase [Blastocatellia bacterium]|nr:Do family serine endopeptidase [Blastocatellia bacterium]